MEWLIQTPVAMGELSFHRRTGAIWGCLWPNIGSYTSCRADSWCAQLQHSAGFCCSKANALKEPNKEGRARSGHWPQGAWGREVLAAPLSIPSPAQGTGHTAQPAKAAAQPLRWEGDTRSTQRIKVRENERGTQRK